MDTQSQQTFDRLVKLDAESLTYEEAQFLYARRPYMNKGQKEQFRELFRQFDREVAAQTKQPEE